MAAGDQRGELQILNAAAIEDGTPATSDTFTFQGNLLILDWSHTYDAATEIQFAFNAYDATIGGFVPVQKRSSSDALSDLSITKTTGSDDTSGRFYVPIMGQYEGADMQVVVSSTSGSSDDVIDLVLVNGGARA